MPFTYLSLQDSRSRASLCESLLYVSRDWLLTIAYETQQIMEDQQYIYEDEVVDLASLMSTSKKYSISPEDRLPVISTSPNHDTTIQVFNETTLMTARRLVQSGRKPLVLNFANGTHAGGGFLSGARAQEETLCYASTLYSTLIDDPMYVYNRQYNHSESTDYMILSQAVVFRDDEYNLIRSPWVMDVVTATAPIAQSGWGGVSQERGAAIMRSRISRLLDVAAAYGYTDLILGAWGCGAFGNDPKKIAALFKMALLEREYLFETVCFTIADWSPERRFLGPFSTIFSREE